MLGPDTGLVVAFSGGPDSTALLWALASLRERRPLRLWAAHLDHGLDDGSPERARRAAEIAAQLDVPWHSRRIDVESRRRPGESLETAARRERYAWLRRLRTELEANWIAVAHHRDDQIETVLLRLLFGSGLTGLSGMRDVHEDLLRPLLTVDRARIARQVESAGLRPVEDPGNTALDRPRNLIRHRLLPRLREQPDFSTAGLLAVARAARGASDRLLERLCADLGVGPIPQATGSGALVEAPPIGAQLDLAAFRSLPRVVRPFALDALRRAAGADYSAPAAARKDLERQLEGTSIGCDCGSGWVWESAGDRLQQKLRGPGDPHDFSYRLRVPGELLIPELGLRLRLTESKPAPWMFRGSKSRAAMSLPLEAGQQVLIRNRRPGDRVRPLGSPNRKKLKDVLIDRRVPRGRRNLLPLLVVEDRIAWVPGVTIDDAFRIGDHTTTWVAELIPGEARTH